MLISYMAVNYAFHDFLVFEIFEEYIFRKRGRPLIVPLRSIAVKYKDRKGVHFQMHRGKVFSCLCVGL